VVRSIRGCDGGCDGGCNFLYIALGILRDRYCIHIDSKALVNSHHIHTCQDI